MARLRPTLGGGCSINMMFPRILILIAALLGAGRPGHAHAGETATEVVAEVTALRIAGKFAEAARLADTGARREELQPALRVVLGGLARQSYELSFAAGGPPNELCKAAEILRHVAPLDTPKGGASKLKAADEAEQRLERAVGPDWRSTCAPPAAPTSTSTVENTATIHVVPRPVAQPPVVMAPIRDARERRRTRAGVGTLVPGLAMFAPMAGLLAYRAAGERELTTLDLETMARPRTDDDYKTASDLNQRYVATTAGAIALGVTGAALVVTGAVLLATGNRSRRLAATPWGASGAGGLVLQGKF